MEGYLYIRKKTDSLFEFKKFNRRFFILNKGILRFLDKQAGKCLGQIHLLVSILSRSKTNQLAFYLNSGTDLYELHAKNPDTVRQWFNFL